MAEGDEMIVIACNNSKTKIGVSLERGTCSAALPRTGAAHGWLHAPKGRAQNPSRSRPRPKKPAVGAADFFLWSARAGVGRPRVCARRANAQDAPMIGKTSRVVAMKYARPTTPRTANTAKDTFSTVMPSFGPFDINSTCCGARYKTKAV